MGEYEGALGVMSVVDGSATYEGVKYTFIGGFGYISEGDKAIGVGVVFLNGTDSAVFFSGRNSSGVSPTGNQALCLKGANGTFAVQCKESAEKVECALWKVDASGALTLEGSTITPAPETPTGLECNSTPLLAKFAKFLEA